MPESSPPVIRVAVIGLGRRGMHYLERWIDSDSIRAVAACDRDRAALDRASSLCDRRTADLDELLADSAIDAVALAVAEAERFSVASRILAAGKHLLADPPVAGTLDETRSLFDAAEAAGRKVVVWCPLREEPDFRSADGVLRSGLVGTPRLIRFERWEPMIRDDSDAGEPVSGPVVDLLNQLVALAAEPARTVYVTSLAEPGSIVTVSFVSGLKAVLTLHATASARIDHGWAIDAERGGYAAGRRWVRTEEGELYEVPADPPLHPSLEELLTASLVGGSPPPQAPIESLRLAALVDAIRRSVETGQAERVEPTP